MRSVSCCMMMAVLVLAVGTAQATVAVTGPWSFWGPDYTDVVGWSGSIGYADSAVSRDNWTVPYFAVVTAAIADPAGHATTAISRTSNMYSNALWPRSPP